VSWPHPLAGGDAIRIEHWTVAAEQGQQAGRNVLLEPDQRKPYDQPPYFWSDQYDTKIQSLGLPGRASRLELTRQLREHAQGLRDSVAIPDDVRNGGQRWSSATIDVGDHRRAQPQRHRRCDPPGFADLRAGVAADEKALGVPRTNDVSRSAAASG
jgi:NADPH-dependent 2,4-dienoyl-CoA reductase/sulfur reductase-like enzyme